MRVWGFKFSQLVKRKGEYEEDPPYEDLDQVGHIQIGKMTLYVKVGLIIKVLSVIINRGKQYNEFSVFSTSLSMRFPLRFPYPVRVY